MSFLLWQRSGESRLAASRLVLRAAEVPLLREAQALRDACEQVHARAQQQLERAAEQARAAAHAQGLAAGRRAAMDELAARLLALADDAAAQRQRQRDAIGALALQVVRKVLGRHADDALLVALAETAADELLPEQPLALVVHPDLCEAVRGRLADATSATSTLRCEVRADASCTRDSCRLETAYGSVDASLEAQLARIEAAWHGATPEETP